MVNEERQTVPRWVPVTLGLALVGIVAHITVGWSWITEARIALAMTTAATLVGAFYVRNQTQTMRDIQKVATAKERTRHDKQIEVLREELSESKRQFEKTGAVLELGGHYGRHDVDRREDTVRFTIRNVGRMTAHVVRASIHTELGNKHEILAEGETVEIESGRLWEATVRRGALKSFGSDLPRRWRGDHVTLRVETGDGRVWYWNEDDGNAASLSDGPVDEATRSRMLVESERSDREDSDT